MKCRTSAAFANSKLKTKKQWKIENKVPIHPEDGELLWSSQMCYKTYMYYRPDQVREMTNEEKEAYRQEKRKKRRQNYEKKKKTEKNVIKKSQKK